MDAPYDGDRGQGRPVSDPPGQVPPPTPSNPAGRDAFGRDPRRTPAPAAEPAPEALYDRAAHPGPGPAAASAAPTPTPDAAPLPGPAPAPDAEPPGGRVSGLLKSSAVMAAGTLVSRITGFVRQLVITAALGATLLGDSYTVA